MITTYSQSELPGERRETKVQQTLPLLGSFIIRTLPLGTFALAFGASAFIVSANPAKQDQVTIIYSYHNDVSPALRDVEPWPVQRVQEHEAAENPLIVTAHVDQPDTVVQTSTLLGRLAPSSLPAQLLNFVGIPYPGVNCSCAPPDTNGEVGATQYVQMVNTAYQVFNKTTGTSVLGPNSIDSLWSGFGGVCQTGRGDPVVVYDQIANRWVISQFAPASGTATDECVAVSTTSDATGTYNRYGFHIGSNFFDYPKISVWPDAYYMSANIFNSTGTTYLGPQAFAMDRTKMLAGQPATLIQMPVLGSTFPPMLPADLDGNTLPPAGAPNSFVLFPNTNTYRVYHFKVGSPFGTGASFTLFGSSTAAAFTQLCPGTRACVPELGGEALDGIGDRLMFRLAYRNFTGTGAHESLVGNFTVNSSGHAGVRWFELRGVTAGPVTTFQQGTYSPDTTWRWMGSIAMDQSGNIALGYSASSATIHPQVRYTGRLVTDPVNTLPQGEATIQSGSGSQASNTFNRWGDYSDITVDPVDGLTFWYTQEYYDTTSSFNWRTRIASFKLAASSSQVVQFSERALIGAGNNIGVGGFIFQGGTGKSVGVRGLGPSVGIPPSLANPYLEIHDTNGTLIAFNDNWQDTQKQQIIDAGLAPSNNLESVIIATLQPGLYTTVLHDKNYGTGVGSTEFYDLQSSSGKFVNASGRSFVGTGNNIAISGFISQGSGTRKYVIRGLGPSLPFGTGNLANPFLKIFDSTNTLLFQNDNWATSQAAQIIATGLAPQNSNEAAILIVLPPGLYTIQLSGVGGGTGIGQIEIYAL